MKFSHLLLGLGCAVGLSGMTHAETAGARAEEPARYFFLNGRFLDPDRDRGSNRGMGVHAGLGFPLTSRLSLEGSLFSQSYEQGTNRGTDFYGRGGQADLVYAFGDRRRFTPFLLAGAGMVYNDVACPPGSPASCSSTANDRYDALINLGAGFVVPLHDESFKLRGEYRRVLDFYADKLQDNVFGLGVEIDYGRRVVVEKPVERVVIQNVDRPVEKLVDREVPPPDSDRDNIEDAKDLCPDTPFGTRTDNTGCPLKAPEPRIVQVDAPDSDGDNIPDSKDRCPNTPPNTRTDNTGCTLVPEVRMVDAPDTDGDNIPDAKDRCPNTPPLARTDNTGCVLRNQIVRLDRIYFDFDKTTLRPESTPAIELAARMMREQPELKIEIAGHTDNYGTDEYNERLSTGRAIAVMQGLLSLGIDPSRLRARGYGERVPVAGNDTDAGRQLNRRVEMRID